MRESSNLLFLLSHLTTSRRGWILAQIKLVTVQFLSSYVLAVLLERFYDHLVLGQGFMRYLALSLVLSVVSTFAMKSIEQFLIPNSEIYVKADLYRQSFAALEKKEDVIIDPTGYTSRLLDATELAAQLIATDLFRFVSASVLSFLSLLVIARISLIFGIVYLVIFITAAIVHTAFYARLSIKRKKLQHDSSHISTYFGETVSGIDTIRAFHQENHAHSESEKVIHAAERSKIEYEKTYALHELVSNMLFYLSEALPIALGFVLFLTHEQNGDLGTVMFLVQFTQPLVNYMIDFNDSFCSIRSSRDSLKELVVLLKENDMRARVIDHNILPNVTFNTTAACISLRDIGVMYGSVPALSHVDFDAHKGECIMIIGESGAGKSTLLNLLMGFSPQYAGSYFLEGINVNQITPATFRQRISFVSQDSSLLPLSIEENLSMGDAAINEVHMKRMLRAVGALELVEHLPLGLKTVIGDEGKRLSGGERQRLAIARALLKKAPILILDEPTSSLDSRHEAIVMRQLIKERQKRCIIMVTHHINCLLYATKIVVLHEGRVIATGTFEELTERGVIKRLKKLYGTRPLIQNE